MNAIRQNPHPHENDNKDDGPQPAADAEQYMVDEHADVIAEISNKIDNPDICPFTELQALAESVLHRRNLRSRDEFCGLSADQIHRLVYFPFDSPEIVEFSDNFPNPPDVAALSLVSFLVDACGDRGLKATTNGYLPSLFCRETAISFWGEEGCKERIFDLKVRKELDFNELHIMRLVAQMTGLIRKYRGRFLRTKKCEKFLASPVDGKLYLKLFTAYTHKFNWGYSDGYSDLYIIQRSFLFSLFLLQKFGDEFRSPAFYEEKFLQAFPTVLDEVSDRVYRSKEEYVSLCYSLRTIQRFAQFFGLIEMDSNFPMPIERNYKIKKLPLLDRLLCFHV